MVFSAGELAGMRGTQVGHMSHRALLYRWQPAQDAESGQMVNAWTADGETACGVHFTAQGAVLEGTEGTVIANYRVRLPLGMAGRAGTLCRLEVVEAFGEVLSPSWLLEQVGPAAPGPSGLVALCRRVAV